MDGVAKHSAGGPAVQGKNPAVNRVFSVFIPSALGLTAVALLVDGCHKIYTGKGKLE